LLLFLVKNKDNQIAKGATRYPNAMPRLRLFDLRNGRLPSVLGLCPSDVNRISRFVNTAQRRLILAREAGSEGWWGTWAEIAFNVSRDEPYITLPRSIARLELINVCDRPAPVQNQFYEYLQFGNGRLPKALSRCYRNQLRTAYSRNNAVTFRELSDAPQLIRVYCTNPADEGASKRVLIQGLDSNGNPVYTEGDFTSTNGIYVTLEAPFVTTATQFDSLTGFQKDKTVGPIQIYQVDPTSGEEVLLLTMDGSETTAWYRRYYFDSLPRGCCPAPGSSDETMVQVKAIAKLELIPVAIDPDYCLIQNEEAIIEECQSVRYSEIDKGEAKSMAQEKHAQAIGYLNGELQHYLGSDQPAIQFKPFGSATLQRQRIGTMI
jgi:hypothetical protein